MTGRLGHRWRGIFKIGEESGELGKELNKLLAYPDGNHPDEHYAGPLVPRVEDELGDLLAALEYFIAHEPRLDRGRIERRCAEKLLKFTAWRLPGVLMSDAPAELIVHALLRGRALCGKVGAPGDWKDGDRWTFVCRAHEITCPVCLKIAETARASGQFDCPRDGDCPVHGKSRPGQAAAVALAAEVEALLAETEGKRPPE